MLLCVITGLSTHHWDPKHTPSSKSSMRLTKSSENIIVLSEMNQKRSMVVLECIVPQPDLKDLEEFLLELLFISVTFPNTMTKYQREELSGARVYIAS